MKRLQLTVVVLLIASACGGGDSTSSGADDTLDAQSSPSTDVVATSDGTVVIESPDGIALIEIDPSSLPDGVSINDVSIVAAINDSDDQTLSLVAARLEPHGTVLSTPATVRMIVPGPPPAGIMTIHQSGNYIQFVESTIERVDETTVITTELSSFSTLSHYSYAGLSVEVVLMPNPVVVGAPQTAVATLALPTEQATFTLAFDSGGGGITAKKYTMSPPSTVRGTAYFIWSFLPGDWNPSIARKEPDGGLSGKPISASSVCIKENSQGLSFSLIASFDLGVLEVADVPDILLLFPILFGQPNPEQPINRQDSGSNWQALDGMGVGGTIAAKSVVLSRVPTSCIDPTTATAAPVLERTEAAEPISMTLSDDGTVTVGFPGNFEELLTSGEFDSVVLEFHSSVGPEVTSFRLTQDNATGEIAATVSENGLQLDGNGTFGFSADGTSLTLGWSDGSLVREGGFNDVQVHIIEVSGGEIFTQSLKGGG